MGVREVNTLLLFYFLELLLIYFTQVHKKQIALTVYFNVELIVLAISSLPNKKSEVKDLFTAYLFSFLIYLSYLNRNHFVVYNFHIALQ